MKTLFLTWFRSKLRAFVLWSILSVPVIAAVAVTAPTPEMFVSLRGVGEGGAEVGEPLRIAVRLEASRTGDGSVVLAPSTGTWAEAIRVELVPANGGGSSVIAERVGNSVQASATLDKGHVAGGMWRIPSGATGQLAPGNYVIRGQLKISSGSGWSGERAAREIPLRLVAVSDVPARRSQRAVNRAQDAMLVGQLEEAASALDAVLQSNPDDFRVLTTRALVAERGGNLFAALMCVNRAAQSAGEPLPGAQPSAEFEELRTRISGAMLKGAAAASEPPKWTWPPASVIVSDKVLHEAALKALGEKSPGATPTAGVTNFVPAPASSVPAVAPAPAANANSVTANPPPAAVTGKPAVGVVVPAAQLTDATLSAESLGQWAASAKASSQYGSTQYSAAQASGAPNISIAGNSPDAWCPANKSEGSDWLEVSFARPVHATEVRVRQNDSAGAIAKIEAFESDGTAHVWWEGVDPYPAPATRDIVWFAVRVPKTDYLVAKVKITLNLATVPGWKEIDAVQLVGADR